MIEHFYQNIDGWFYAEDVYDDILKLNQDGAHFVEVGSFFGKSSSYMAVNIINSNKKIKFDCVDTWRGSSNMKNMPCVINDTMYDTFITNMKPVTGYYNDIKMASVEAAKLYENNSLNFVFLDAGHEYKNVKDDIIAWLPKIKPGGILAGDDLIDRWPGVSMAVNELLKKAKVKGNASNPCWWYVKPLKF